MAIGTGINNHASLIWAIADLLRGDYKPAEYQKVVLPLVLLRRLDCVLEPSKQRVLDRVAKTTVQNYGPLLKDITGSEVYNTPPLTMRRVLEDPNNVAAHRRAWIAGFEGETREVIEKFCRVERQQSVHSLDISCKREIEPTQRLGSCRLSSGRPSGRRSP